MYNKATKKVYFDEYLTYINKEGKARPRIPSDYKDEKKYGKDYLQLFMDTLYMKLNQYEEHYKTPLAMVTDIDKLHAENDKLRRENDRLMQRLKKKG